MVIATDIPSTNKTQDQMTDLMSTNSEDNGMEKNSEYLSRLNFCLDLLDVNSVSSTETMKYLPSPPTSSKPNKSRSVSIGVSPFPHLEEDPNQSQTKTEQYVSDT